MEYFKCNNCGHLNSLKTEYQVFCSECKKKFVNNFSDWKRINPSQSFEDFKKIFCISEFDIENTKVQKKPRNKHGVKYYIVFAIAFAIFYGIGKYGYQFISEGFGNATYDKAMMKVASKLNKTCPIMVDSETRLDNTVSLPNNIFQYNYTLVNAEKGSIDVDQVRDFIEPNVINNIKTKPEMKFYKDNEVTMQYHYKDKNGVTLLMITVTSDKYIN